MSKDEKPYENFKEFLGKLIAVPKSEIDKRANEYNKRKEERKKREAAKKR